MARLRNLAPGLGSLPPSMAYAPGDDKARDRHRADQLVWRKWYALKPWKDLRQAVLLRDRYTCQMCGCVEPDMSKLVGDHKVPHRGDKALFFDPGNVQTLCKTCHDSAKQKEDRLAGFW